LNSFRHDLFEGEVLMTQEYVITASDTLAPFGEEQEHRQQPISESEQRSLAEKKFAELAAQWRKETRHVSSIHERSMNAHYQKIIGMGKAVLPFIFHDLQRTHDHWIWALNAIVDNDPAAQAEDFNEAVDAWLNWGMQQGYLP
jgi:hypothetical protein